MSEEKVIAELKINFDPKAHKRRMRNTMWLIVVGFMTIALCLFCVIFNAQQGRPYRAFWMALLACIDTVTVCFNVHEREKARERFEAAQHFLEIVHELELKPEQKPE